MDFEIATQSTKPSGITRILYAVKSELSTIAEPPSSPATQEEAVTIASDHVFSDVDNGWREIFFNDDQSVAEFETTGDRFAKTGKSMVKVIIPGDKKEVAAFIAADPELIILVQENPCQAGMLQQIGTKCRGAKIEGGAKWTSGTANGETVIGWEVTISCNQPSKLWYGGVVTLPSA